MKRRTLVCLGLLGLLVVLGPAAQVVPVAVSPGRAGGVAIVAELCPTFSWTSVDWAVGYRVSVFEALGIGVVSYEQMASGGTEPVLSREIEGRGLSWTPSSEEGLRTGAIYVWYVEAMSLSGPGVWSAGKVFIVDAGAISPGTEERVMRILREKGIREEVITDALKEMKSGVTGEVAGEVGTKPQGDVRAMGTEGATNTFYGLEAGASITTGTINTFIGRQAGYHNTSGIFNTFLGHQAGYSIITGNNNTMLGLQAGNNNTSGNGNVFLGFQAGSPEMGSNKLYIDNSNTSSPLIYGEFDNDILAVNGRFGVGTQAPTYPMELKTTGRNATFILQRSDGGAINFVNATPAYGQFGTGNNFPVRILVNQTWRMSLNTDNSLSMASGATCTAGGVWTNSSSRELKEDIKELSAEEANAALEELAPVKYAYKADRAERHVGFIAEDVPALVASKDRKTVSPMDVVGVLTKVVQEQQKTIAELKDKVAELEKKGKLEK